MKTLLTKDQTARLIELGVDAGKATGRIRVSEPIATDKRFAWNYDRSLFTLSDLLAILPKWIKHRHYLCFIEMGVDRYSETWYARYVDEHGVDEAETSQSAEELIDALYELLAYCIENNLINPQ